VPKGGNLATDEIGLVLESVNVLEGYAAVGCGMVDDVAPWGCCVGIMDWWNCSLV
jgi:hypothetical protein